MNQNFMNWMLSRLGLLGLSLILFSCASDGPKAYQAYCTNEARHPGGTWKGAVRSKPEAAEEDVTKHILQSNFGCDRSFVKVRTIDLPKPADIEKLVAKISQGKLIVATGVNPNFIVDDFNFDQVQDLAVIVELKDSVQNLRKIIEVQNPYASAWGSDIDPKMRGVLIVHGKGKGWQSQQSSQVLIVGRNAVPSLSGEKMQGVAMTFEENEHGKSSICFPTEAARGFLTWNGKKYTWFEEEP